MRWSEKPLPSSWATVMRRVTSLRQAGMLISRTEWVTVSEAPGARLRNPSLSQPPVESSTSPRDTETAFLNSL
jgi:hypothetical protein